MELEHSFIIPVPPEQAWPALLDVERIAPCMPGATVDSVDGDVIKGRIKVKVGPVQLTYAGTAHFTERDEQARTAISALEGVIDTGAAYEVWAAARRAAEVDLPTWIHGDVTASNLLVVALKVHASSGDGFCGGLSRRSIKHLANLADQSIR